MRVRAFFLALILASTFSRLGHPGRAQGRSQTRLQAALHARLEAELNRVAEHLDGVMGFAIKDLSTDGDIH